MLKPNIVLILGIIVVLSSSESIRILQSNNPLCERFTPDGTICLQCSFRSYFDVLTKLCKKVNDQCKSWDLTTGDCLTCYDGYGNA